MSCFSDVDIKLAIERGILNIMHGGTHPISPDAIKPASVDLRLSGTVMRFRKPTLLQHLFKKVPIIDTAKSSAALMTASRFEPVIVLKPGDFVLAATSERVTLSDLVVARVEGKSSLGRLGLSVHVTAGFIDPGFDGYITLEITNLSPLPIKLYAGMYICQVAFQNTMSRCSIPYSKERGSKYTDQVTADPVASRVR